MKTIIMTIIILLITIPAFAKPIELLKDKDTMLIEMSLEEISGIEGFVKKELSINTWDAGYILIGRQKYRSLDRANIENYMFKHSYKFLPGANEREFERGAYYVHEQDERKYRVIEFDGLDKGVLAHELAHMYGANEEKAKEIEFKVNSQK